MLHFLRPRSRPDALAAEIRASLMRPGAPEPGSYDALTWRDAIYTLVDRGEFDAAKYGAGRFLAANTDVSAVRTLCRVLDVLPPAEPSSPFSDNPRKDVQIVRWPGAETVILVFSDVNHTLGLPFAAAHRWLARAKATIVYLRDRRNLWFVSGLRSLGGNRHNSVERLRRIVARLGARHIVCYGNSSGGFSAIRYGIELGADAVVSMAGPTDITTLKAPKWRPVQMVADVKNLRDVLATAERPPQVLMVCGEHNWDDRIQADNIADLPTVTVRLVERYDGHAVAVELMCRRQMDRVLEWLMTSTPNQPRDISSFAAEAS